MDTFAENAASIGSKLSELWCEILSCPPPINALELWDQHIKISNELVLLKLANCDQLRKQSRLEQLATFLEWSDKMGIQHSNLEIHSSPHGLCLSTTESIEEGTVVLEVPLSAIFSTDIAESVPSLKKILDGDELLQSMENVALVIAVAHEVLRRSESKWAAYFSVLPLTYSTPIFYTEEQLQALKPSPVFEETLLMYRAIARQFVYFYLRIIGKNGKKGRKCASGTFNAIFAGSPFTAQNFTFDFYRWCVSVVSTRINMVPSQHKINIEDGKPRLIPALIPFLDMANHAHSSTNPGSVYFEHETNSVKIQVLKKCIEGAQELYIHYGPRTNSKFLLHNGFVPQLPNPDNYFELKIGLHRSTSDFKSKFQKLAEHSILPMFDNSQKSVIYSFQLKMESSIEQTKLSQLFTFAKIFVAESNLGSIEAQGNIQKAKKFICDRLNLLIRVYKGTHPLSSKDCVENDIQRLKEAEKAILSSQLKCFEEII